MTGYDGGVDMARVMYGENARHVPGFLYVQDAGPGVVSFVGSSMTPGENPHPLRYGAPHYRDGGGGQAEGYPWQHHLIVGEIIVRPHVVVATRALAGFGLGQLLTDGPPLEDLVEAAAGRLVVGSSARLAEIIHRNRTAAWRGPA